MTTRTVKIIKSVECCPSENGIDSSPQRTIYFLEGVNCTPAEFNEWFLETKEGNDFCSTISGDTLIDIGGSILDMADGNLMSVSFDRYITHWKHRQKRWLLNHIRMDAIKAYECLGIEHLAGEALCLMAPKKRCKAMLNIQPK